MGAGFISAFISIRGGTYMQKITAGGIDLTGIIQEASEKAELPENQLIGAAISRQLELKILLYEATAEQKAAIKAGVYKYNGNTYTVYSQPKHYDDTISITAYDRMASASKKYRDPGVSGDYTAREIWEDIASKMGVVTDSSILGDAGSIVCKGKAKLGAHTMRDLLAWIAEAAGKNAIIINDQLTLKGLSKAASLTAEDATELTEANHITIDKVKKWKGDDLLSAGTGDTSLYLSTGNPLVGESQVTSIYGLYGGLDIYECSALKTWCSQTAELNLGDLMAYNGKAYIITGYTRSHHGNTAEDSLELTGSTATNATKGEVTTKTKASREDGLDGSTYMPDQTPTGTSTGTGTGTGVASELRTNPGKTYAYYHIKGIQHDMILGDGSSGISITEGASGPDTIEDGQQSTLSPRIEATINGDTAIRVIGDDDWDNSKLIYNDNGSGSLYFNGSVNMLQRGAGCEVVKHMLIVDEIICRSLTISKNPNGATEIIVGTEEDAGVSGTLNTPIGSFYIENGIIVGGSFGPKCSFVPYYGHEDDGDAFTFRD